MLELNKVFHGNNLDLLKQLPNNSVDSVVTDPPYGINFMNKKWDYDVPSVETWKEVLRVLKPGGHALVACGTRTQHRMAVNLEDAGFEIRDLVAWIYGSGFPKSMDISKAIDKAKGAEREVVGKLAGKGSQSGVTLGSTFGGQSGGFNHAKEYDETLASTAEAKQWAGWGTALKPAMELWTLCRKPVEGTIASNVLKYGTGGINIDGCRVGEREEEQFTGTKKPKSESGTTCYGDYNYEKSNTPLPLGRFPANVIHDGSEEVLAVFPNTNASCSGGISSGRNFGQEYDDTYNKLRDRTGHDDNGGSASRFFYAAKTSQSERNEGLYGFEEVVTTDGREKPIDNAYNRGETVRRNIHPTVKPLDLMRYLCRMITPKGGIVLEPFAGSGSTCIAAKLEEMNFIGMEISEEYVKIAESRIANCTKDNAVIGEMMKDETIKQVFTIDDFLGGD